MFKNLLILGVLALIVALPFIFRQPPPAGDWKEGDPVVVIVSPHNEAIRFEFAQAFSKWHAAHYQRPDGTPQPAKVDWRSIGGTTEISRYLQAAFTSSTRAWWERSGKTWPAGATDAITDTRPPQSPELAKVYHAMRSVDDPDKITSGIDLFFGGGEYDHSDINARGGAVPVWPDGNPPPGLFEQVGVAMIPQTLSGEIWRTPTLFGNAVSTFGICSNLDRLRQLGIHQPASSWTDLANPIYRGQVGVADPTKSGSIAKTFEMIIHQQIHDRVAAAGFSDDEIDRLEDYITTHHWKSSDKAGAFPRIEVYQRSIEGGWADGLHLVQRIGANARYFTDSASKVPIDVSIGDAAVGMAIDFYGRFQAQNSVGPNGETRMVFVTPIGGTSVSCDPITLLRGAPHRGLAVEFITFVLSEDGQKLWTYKPGEPGGPVKFALRRLPIRRDFYPSTNPVINATAKENASHAADPLADPTVDPYEVAKKFTYRPRWTARLFGIQRSIVRAMCIDSADELKAAWTTINDHGGPDKCPQAMAKLAEFPTVTLTDHAGHTGQVALTWETAGTFSKNYDALDYMREWTNAFRQNYADAKALAEQGK
jgi:ABC-type Fe3+ transport system substrate-binding protein